MTHFRSPTLFAGSLEGRLTCPACARQLRPVGGSATGLLGDPAATFYYVPAHGPRTCRCPVWRVAVVLGTGEVVRAEPTGQRPVAEG